jgi:hypothetical protein
MFCSHCGEELNYKDLNNDGWCDRCARIVGASPCKVPFWNLLAVFVMAWTLAIRM